MSVVNITNDVLPILQANGYTVTVSQTALLNQLNNVAQRTLEQSIGWRIEQSVKTEYYPSWSPGRSEIDPLIAGYEVLNNRVIPRQLVDFTGSILRLTNIPINSITSIYENFGAWQTAGGDWPTSTLLPTNAYYLDIDESGVSWSGNVYRNIGMWSRSPRTIKIIFNSGLSAAQLDLLTGDYASIKQAIILIVIDWYMKFLAKAKYASTSGMPITSVSIEDFSVTFGIIAGINDYKQAIPTEALQIVQEYINMNQYI